MEHQPKSPAQSAPEKPGRWVVPGLGLLQGLAVTGRNFVESFYKKERMTTVEYPEERAPISPNFRNFPFLVYDNDPKAGLRCTACSICEKECPPQCIYIVLERDENGKSLKRPKIFDIDISVCMNCGICAEVCPFDSIYMDGEYELSGEDRFGGLLLGLDRLSKSAEYHMQLRPEQASEVMARRKADEEKKAAAAAAKAAKAKADAEAKAKAAEQEKGGDA
jgi:NADH-quinone oxidoreductase subunit I